MAKAGSLTPIQQFLYYLKTTPNIVYYIYRYNDNDNDKFERIFQIYDFCLELWRKNLKVLSFNSTYKVNRFDILLLQIYGLTYIYITFNVAYYLLSGEKEDYFSQVLSVLQLLLIEYEILPPFVIISDYDKVFKKAYRKLFNDGVQYQICLQHVIKNVAFNTKKRWLGSFKGTSLREQGTAGSYLRDDKDDDGIGVVASQLLAKEDYNYHLPEAICNSRLHLATDGYVMAPSCRWLDNVDGFLYAWAVVVYSDIEEQFWDNWNTLMNEFREQVGKLYYIFSELIALR